MVHHDPKLAGGILNEGPSFIHSGYLTILVGDHYFAHGAGTILINKNRRIANINFSPAF